MSYAIMRAIKVKTASDVVGCEIHNERLKDHSNTNPDIDFDKAKDDYQIGEYGTGRYNQRIDKEIKERYKGKRAIRKDATRCIELMFTSDGDFFKGLTQEQEKAYFKDCYEFAVAHFGGRANIIGDKVHKDEETPHMHLDIVPLTADGRLSAKEFLGGKKELQALQDKFYEEVGRKWGLERGNRADLDKGESGTRHKSMQELKTEKRRNLAEAELANIESRKERLTESVDKLQRREMDLQQSVKTLERQALEQAEEKKPGKEEEEKPLTEKQIKNIKTQPYEPLFGKSSKIFVEGEDFKKLKNTALLMRKTLQSIVEPLQAQIKNLTDMVKQLNGFIAQKDEIITQKDKDIQKLNGQISVISTHSAEDRRRAQNYQAYTDYCKAICRQHGISVPSMNDFLRGSSAKSRGTERE